MSRSKLDINELEAKFDAILESISEDDVQEWNRFDQTRQVLDMFLSGQFQPTEISDTRVLSILLNPCTEQIPCGEQIEVFSYTVSEAS
jgi:hypothetical protein